MTKISFKRLFMVAKFPTVLLFKYIDIASSILRFLIERLGNFLESLLSVELITNVCRLQAKNMVAFMFLLTSLVFELPYCKNSHGELTFLKRYVEGLHSMTKMSGWVRQFI